MGLYLTESDLGLIIFFLLYFHIQLFMEASISALYKSASDASETMLAVDSIDRYAVSMTRSLLGNSKEASKSYR